MARNWDKLGLATSRSALALSIDGRRKAELSLIPDKFTCNVYQIFQLAFFSGSCFRCSIVMKKVGHKNKLLFVYNVKKLVVSKH